MPNVSPTIPFDFKNGDLKGPFNYDQSEDDGCGGKIDDEGNWRVEISKCQYAGIHVYITGFFINPTDDEVTNQFLLDLNVITLPGDENYIGTSGISINSDPTMDGLSLGLDLANIDVADQERKVQLSMVFVGVREYSQGDYPKQVLFSDDFHFNAINSDLLTNTINF